MLLQWQRDRAPLQDFVSVCYSQRPWSCVEETIGGVPTVDALAYNFYDAEALICPIMDARRKQVYTGIYRFEEHQLMTLKEQMGSTDRGTAGRTESERRDGYIFGRRCTCFRELIAEKLQVPYSFAPAHVNKQRAAAVAALGSIYYKEGRTETAMEHIPEYLRVSQAERERAEREKEQKPAGTKIR